jgi:hypothetical protein
MTRSVGTKRLAVRGRQQIRMGCRQLPRQHGGTPRDQRDDLAVIPPPTKLQRMRYVRTGSPACRGVRPEQHKIVSAQSGETMPHMKIRFPRMSRSSSNTSSPTPTGNDEAADAYGPKPLGSDNSAVFTASSQSSVCRGQASAASAGHPAVSGTCPA